MEGKTKMALKEETVQTSEGPVLLRELSFRKQLELMSLKEATLENIYRAYVPSDSDWDKLDRIPKEEGKKIFAVIEGFRALGVRDPNQPTSSDS
jgi:hypothetical protein